LKRLPLSYLTGFNRPEDERVITIRPEGLMAFTASIQSGCTVH